MSAPSIVKAQQAYATTQKLAKLFEDLTTALVYARPADPAAFISAEVVRMAQEGEAYRAKPINGVVDTEESAAAYWEDERVRALLEVRRALREERALARAARRAAKGPLRLTLHTTHTTQHAPLCRRARAGALCAALAQQTRGPLRLFEGREPKAAGAARGLQARALLPHSCRAGGAAALPPSDPRKAHATPPLPPLQSTMFTDSDLQGMFSLFDPVSNNYITADQARTALRNLGIKDLSSVPEAAGARLDSKAFLALARAALDKERTL